MFMPTNLLTRYNHYQITHITHLMFIMGHKLLGKSPSFTILRDNFVSIHGNIDSLLHFIRDYPTDECTTWIFTRRIVDERPAGDGGHVGKFSDGHVL